METLIERYLEKYSFTSTEPVRDFINTVDWSNRFVGIRGSRGVGKTTMLLQYLKLNYKPGNKVLYVSLDHLYFSNHTLYCLADEFYKKGGELLAIDEVHRYPSWAIELKNMYDDFPALKVIFTGSSMLQLARANADLSRRVVMYEMPGLSFREFLRFSDIATFQKISMDELVAHHTELAMGINQKIRPLEHFGNYLNYGYYPFYLENLRAFHQKLHETIQVVLDVDIPQFESIQISGIVYLKRLLQIIAASVPFKPNLTVISQRTGISLNTLKQYLKYLNESGLVYMLHPSTDGINSLNKPEKIYLQNTNLIFTLAPNNTETGNLRETFLLSQMYGQKVIASKQADFVINDKYVLEIGGKNKSKRQISDTENGFIVKDQIVIGSDNIIPLWLFGFLY